MTKAPPPQPGTPSGCERIAYVVGFKESATYSDVYGGGGAVVGLDCHLVRPIDRPSDTLIVFMHPVGGGMYLPMVRALADAGHHVLWANSRYRGASFGSWSHTPIGNHAGSVGGPLLQRAYGLPASSAGASWADTGIPATSRAASAARQPDRYRFLTCFPASIPPILPY